MITWTDDEISYVEDALAEAERHGDEETAEVRRGLLQVMTRDYVDARRRVPYWTKARAEA